MSDQWIWINRWETFQHYRHAPANPPAWTKMYTQLVNDETYLSLSSHQRAVLHGVWLSFASARCHLRADTSLLSSRLRLRVMTRDLEALSDAGFLTICSRPALEELYKRYRASLASRAPARSREEEEEAETPSKQRKVSASSSRSKETSAAAPAGPDGPAPLIDCPHPSCHIAFRSRTDLTDHLESEHRVEAPTP